MRDAADDFSKQSRLYLGRRNRTCRITAGKGFVVFTVPVEVMAVHTNPDKNEPVNVYPKASSVDHRCRLQ